MENTLIVEFLGGLFKSKATKQKEHDAKMYGYSVEAHKALVKASKHPNTSQEFHSHMGVYHKGLHQYHTMNNNKKQADIHAKKYEFHSSHVKDEKYKSMNTTHWDEYKKVK